MNLLTLANTWPPEVQFKNWPRQVKSMEIMNRALGCGVLF